MNSLIVKCLCGLGGIGAVSVGTYATFKYSNSSTSTIKNHIEKELKLELVSSLSKDVNTLKAQWTAEYEIDKEAIKKVIVGIQDTNGGEKLSEWCDQQLSADFSKEKDLSNVLKWCVSGSNTDKLPKNKETLNDQSASADWDAIYEAENNQTDRNKLNLANSKASGSKDEDVRKIKEFCNSKRDRKFLSNEKESSYDLFLKWCTKNKTT